MNQLTKYFEVPTELYPYIDLMLSKEEIMLIKQLKDNKYSYDELIKLISDNFDLDPKDFIDSCYKRGIINKEKNREVILYTSANVHTRLDLFAQYEEEVWKTIPEADRKLIDQWFVTKYTERALPRLKEVKAGKRRLIENAYFYTLEEILTLIEDIDKDIYVVPCNCKSVAQKCDKPKNVCIHFDKGINSEWDRGLGTPVTKEEAKNIVKMANKKGLMHTSEAEEAICNCESSCCYPIRASKIIGAKGIWPEKRYNILWDQQTCINCGKCSKICNFNAFETKDKVTSFDPSKCWGCTICKDHCPVNAITIKKIE